MNKKNKTNDSLVANIKNIIRKYCPHVENRLLIFEDPNSSQLDILINIDDNKTIIRFLFGNSTYKTSAKECELINRTIELSEIEKIIDFVIEDHEIIKGIDIQNNKLDLIFDINWNNENVRGIYCGDIKLNLTFSNVEMEREYLYFIFQKYYSYLEQSPSFKRMKDKYIDISKKAYLDSLNKQQILSFLSKMSEVDLKDLLHSIDNDLFIKYTTEDNKQDTKKLLLKRNRLTRKKD